MTPASIFVCHVVLSHVCMKPRHSVSELSWQQPLYVQGLVLCYDFLHSSHADIVGESCVAHTYLIMSQEASKSL